MALAVGSTDGPAQQRQHHAGARGPDGHRRGQGWGDGALSPIPSRPQRCGPRRRVGATFRLAAGLHRLQAWQESSAANRVPARRLPQDRRSGDGVASGCGHRPDRGAQDLRDGSHDGWRRRAVRGGGSVPETAAGAAMSKFGVAKRRWARWRDRLRERPTYDLAYRLVVGVVGLVVLGLGILAIPYPGPGWAIVFVGLAILATEFEWAHRLLRYTRERYDRFMDWFKAQGLWVKALGFLLTAVVVAATLWLLGALGFAAGLVGVEQPWLKSPIGLGS